MVGATAAAVVVVPARRATLVVVRATVVVVATGVVVDAVVLGAVIAALEATAVVGAVAAEETVEPELLHPPMSAAMTATPKSRRTGRDVTWRPSKMPRRASGVARSPRRPGPATWEEAPRCLLCR
jgi:hypothetical protein